MTLKIKSDFKDTVLAFGGGGNTPLGQRSAEDLNKLAQYSHADPSLRQYFDGEIPALEDLKKAEVTGNLKTADKTPVVKTA